MEYALKVLNRYSSIPGHSSRRMWFVNEVTCAYCDGSGADPKYDSASGCPVCHGAGLIQVTPPVVTCRQCAGSGRTAGDLSCLSCRGVGMVSVRIEADLCSHCGGSGEEGIFPCNACKGLGII
jgi:DnaJ-class molecular chaperone